MDQKTTRTIGDCHLEHSWILIGQSDNKLWWGRRRKMTKGHPCSVDFDPNYVLTREQTKHDIVGFLHSHPGMIASPSSTDYATIRAWVNCFGKPLVCVIQGSDGLRGYWFDDDESRPVECQVKRFGSLLVGTTEMDVDFEDFEDFDESEEEDGEQQVSSRGDLQREGLGEEAPSSPPDGVWGGSVRVQPVGQSSTPGLPESQSN